MDKYIKLFIKLLKETTREYKIPIEIDKKLKSRLLFRTHE